MAASTGTRAGAARACGDRRCTQRRPRLARSSSDHPLDRRGQQHDDAGLEHDRLRDCTDRDGADADRCQSRPHAALDRLARAAGASVAACSASPRRCRRRVVVDAEHQGKPERGGDQTEYTEPTCGPSRGTGEDHGSRDRQRVAPRKSLDPVVNIRAPAYFVTYTTNHSTKNNAPRKYQYIACADTISRSDVRPPR